MKTLNKHIIGTFVALALTSMFLWANTTSAFFWWWERWLKWWFWCPMVWWLLDENWTWFIAEMQEHREKMQEIRNNSDLTDEQKSAKLTELMNKQFEERIAQIKSNEYLSEKWKEYQIKQMTENHNKIIEKIKENPDAWFWMWMRWFDKKWYFKWKWKSWEWEAKTNWWQWWKSWFNWFWNK